MLPHEPNPESARAASEHDASQQQMRLGTILNNTLQLYRDNFWLLIGIAAVMYIPFGLIRVLVTLSFEQDDTVWVDVLLGVVEIWLVNPMVMGALVFAVAQTYRNTRTDVWEAYSQVRFASILGASLLIGLGTGAMAVTIIGLPFAVYFGVRWSLFCPCITLEGRGARDAMRRSSALVRTSWWRVFGIELVIWTLVFAVFYIPTFLLIRLLNPLAVAHPMLVPTVVTIIAAILVTPIGLTGLTLVYFALRRRNENLRASPVEQGGNAETGQTMTER